MGKFKNIAMWVLTIFFLLSGLAFLPQIAGFSSVLAAALLFPLWEWQNLLNKCIGKKIKPIIVIVMIIITIITVPNNEPTGDNGSMAQSKEEQEHSEAIGGDLSVCYDSEQNSSQNINEDADSILAESAHEAEQTYIDDWGIITLEGHPRIWDREELPHNIWDGIENGKIRFPDSNSDYQDTNIVYMESMKDENGDRVICDIQVYFQNFADSANYTLEEVLPIIYTYLPVSMVDNYEVSMSYIAVPEDAEKTTHYFIKYSPTDEAKESGDKFYGVSIEIQVNDEVVQLFRLSLNLPKWANYLERNGYTKEEWGFDFLTE